jgi:small subunit ribosomal protein S1
VEKTRSFASVKIEGIRGWISNSDRRIDELIIGDELPLKILVGREELDLQLIRCSTLMRLRQLQVGHIVSGKVRSVKPYGVFVFIDSEGLTALLLISKIIPTVDHPGQIFAVDDAVKAIVAGIDWERAWVNLENCEKLA